MVNMRVKRVMADTWPRFVDDKKRWRTEIPFILSQRGGLERPTSYFNASLGSGSTTIGLEQSGLVIPEKILSNEVEPEFVRVAMEQAKNYDIPLRLTTYDWRDERLSKTLAGQFDLVLCLGNNMTLIPDRTDRLKALRTFHALLKPWGKLIVDERNYQQILEGKFKDKKEVVYCGESISVKPLRTSPTNVKMGYFDRDSGKRLFDLNLHPFKPGELVEEIEAAGFWKPTTYGDYKLPVSDSVQFLTHVARNA